MNKFKSKVIRYGMLVMILAIFAFVIGGCSRSTSLTYSDVENAIQTKQKEKIKQELYAYLDLSKITDVQEETNISAEIRNKINTLMTSDIIIKDTSEFLALALEELSLLIEEGKVEATQSAETYKETIMIRQLEAAKIEATTKIDEYSNIKKLEDHQQEKIDKAKIKYLNKVDNITTTEAKMLGLVRTSQNSCAGTPAQSVKEEEFDQAIDVYEIVWMYTIEVDRYKTQPAPIQFYGFGNGFWGSLFNNFFVFPIGWLLWFLSKLFGGYYVIGLIITTLLVRTAGWPIYARTNDMSLKMQIMQPELTKLESKYEKRTDPESQRAKQMEMAQIYKKYKVGIGGCLLPFLQFPIFMSIFRAISRLPYTDGTVNGTANWVKDLNTTVLGIDLFKDRTQGGSWQSWGVIILAALVVVTQLVSQFIMQRKQKQAQTNAQADVPEYRRQAANQANETQKTMKYMMYFMTIMMATFVLSSAAGLGFYWLIGNLYSMIQSLLGQKGSQKRLEKIKNKHLVR